MIAAQIFNAREGNEVEKIYGAVSIGNQWKFLELEGATARIDKADYYIKDVTKSWAFCWIWRQAASLPPLPLEKCGKIAPRRSPCLPPPAASARPG